MTSTSINRSICLFVLFVVALVSHICPSQSACADQPNAIISNMFQANSGTTTYSGGSLAAEAFTTPSSNLDLTTVVLRVGGPGNTGQTTVELWSAAGNQPGSHIADLAVLLNPQSQTDVTLQLGVNSLLTASTTYFIVLFPAAGASISWTYTNGNSFIVGSGSLPFIHAESLDDGASWSAGVAGRSSVFMTIGCTDNNVATPAPSPVANGFPSIVMPVVVSSSPIARVPSPVASQASPSHVPVKASPSHSPAKAKPSHSPSKSPKHKAHSG